MKLTQIVEKPGKGIMEKHSELKAEDQGCSPGWQSVMVGKLLFLLGPQYLHCKLDLSKTLPALTHDDSVRVKNYAEACICASHCPEFFHTHVDSFVSHDNAMK